MYDEMTYDVIPKILHHHPIRIFTSPQDECAGHHDIHSSKGKQVVTQSFITLFCSRYVWNFLLWKIKEDKQEDREII